jgi:hypothetical protein
MPKKDVDYSNTIIYKICCKDEIITELYVGHTTNFIQRKYTHKIACNNSKKPLKIYNVIRSNGGWDNWDMIEIAKYCCKDATEARIKEQEHYNELKASLNSYPPYVDIKKYFCNICNVQCMGPKQYNQHMNCIKHQEIKKTPKNAIFDCSFCNFKCSKNSDWIRHITTDKHNRRKDGNKMETFEPKKNANYACKCGKIYSTNSGLWKHSKTCNFEDEKYVDTEEKESITTSNEIHELKEIMKYLMKENSEFKNIILEQQNMMMGVIKTGTHNITTNNNNSHNKAFNLNLFLNETCKNAMNITDFIDSIKLQLSDLMEIGEIGYVEGISKIIVKNLNNLDETIRPVHCTDKKRETMYIKDEGEWNKEDEKKTKLKKAVTKVADKNIKLLPLFREKYPDYKNSSSKTSDKYDKMVLEVMTCDDDKNEKIITNISKITTIKE